MTDWYDSFLSTLQSLSWLQILGLSVGLFLASFTFSLAFTAWAVVQIPANYFANGHDPTYTDRHPVVHCLFLVGKNLIGVLLIVLGVLLSLPGVPGQGILTILIGIMLLNFPGKRRLEMCLVRRPRIRSTIDRLRGRFGKPPLVLDD